MQEAQIITAETTLHQDLVAQDGLIVQLLTAVANGGFTAAQAAQMLADFQTDDGNAKTRIAAMQAALGGSGSSSSSSTTAPNPPSSTAP